MDQEILKAFAEKSCQSPIETALFIAYLTLLGKADSNLVISGGGADHDRLNAFYGEIPKKQRYHMIHHQQTDFIWTQLPIGKYRADMAVARISYEVEEVDGDYLEVLVKSPMLIVECDGHDFHERTKEQAKHDKSRDRSMLADGYRVIRFTGSEIYNDSAGCAAEMDAILRSFAVSVAKGG